MSEWAGEVPPDALTFSYPWDKVPGKGVSDRGRFQKS